MKIIDLYLNYLNEGYFLIAEIKAAQDYKKKLEKEMRKKQKVENNNEGIVVPLASTGGRSFVNYQRVRKSCESGCRKYLSSRPMYIKCVKTCKKSQLSRRKV